VLQGALSMRPNRALSSVTSGESAVAAVGGAGGRAARTAARTGEHAHGSEGSLHIGRPALGTWRLVPCRVLGHGHPDLEREAAVLALVIVSGHFPSALSGRSDGYGDSLKYRILSFGSPGIPVRGSAPPLWHGVGAGTCGGSVTTSGRPFHNLPGTDPPSGPRQSFR
jgi:hypothetical protein